MECLADSLQLTRKALEAACVLLEDEEFLLCSFKSIDGVIHARKGMALTLEEFMLDVLSEGHRFDAEESHARYTPLGVWLQCLKIEDNKITCSREKAQQQIIYRLQHRHQRRGLSS